MSAYLARGPVWLDADLPTFGPLQVVALFAGLGTLALAWRRPEAGLLMLVGLTYTNASEVAVRFHGVPSPLMLIALATTAGAIWRGLRTGSHTPEPVVDPILAPLAIYALVLFASSLAALNPAPADRSLFEFGKGVLVFVLLTNLVTTPRRLRQVSWVLVLSGAFLGTISVYQFLTHSYDQTLGGFGRIKTAQIVGETFEPRISGSLSDPNFYAQILVMVVPVALYRLWEESELRLKAVAGYALAATALAAIFTYSRGGAVALALVLALALLHKRISPRYLLLGLAVLAPLSLLVPESFQGRLTTLTQFAEESSSGVMAREDSSFRQRRLLMTVAWEEFLDHPVIGVGAGNYNEHFSTYSTSVGSTQRSYDKFDLQHFPHSLPLEILAETGLVGLIAFGAIVVATFSAALSAYRAFKRAQDVHSANLVMALALSVVAFITTSIFLHGAYSQYLWLIVAVIAAARQISRRLPSRAATTNADWVWQLFDRHRTPEPARLAGSAPAPAPASATPARPQVAYVMSRFPLLTETFILREMLELEAQGMELMVFPLLRARATVRHAELERLRARVWYTPFLNLPILSANLHYLRRQPRRYLGLLGQVLRGNWGSANLLFGAVGIFPKAVYLARLVEQQGVRHIHAHYATHPALAALVASELAGVGFSFTVHAHDIFLHQQMLGEKARKARFVAAISRFNKRFILDRAPDLPPDRIKVVHCGIEPALYEAVASRRMADKPVDGAPLTALCVASLQPYKGITHLVRAVAQVREAVPGFRCLVAGEGADRPALEAQIAELGLEDAFELLGGRPQHEVAALLASADLFVLPSVIAPSGQMEGIPVALMEAMASRLPVVTTRISGIPELVEHGVNGLLVEPGDHAALADALVALCHDPDLRTRMGEAGQRKVAAEFALADNVRRLHGLFERELAGQGGLSDGVYGWVEQHTGNRPRVVRAGGGRDSAVYTVSAPGAQTLILKLHRPHWASGAEAAERGEVHARREYEALKQLGTLFAWHGPALAVPRAVALDPDHAALLMERAAGDKLSLALRWAALKPRRAGTLREGFAGCGEWLALWQAATEQVTDPTPVAARVRDEFERELKLCWERGLDRTTVRAAHARFEAGLAAWLSSRPPVVDCHCDFAPYNVLVSPGRTTVIDFEGVRPGFALEDLSYFLAMLEAVPAYHLGRRARVALREVFLAGYQRHARFEPAALDLFMLMARVKIMARSPLLDPATTLIDRVKRWQRLMFTRHLIAGSLG